MEAKIFLQDDSLPNQYVRRMENWLERQHEWAMFHRFDIINRANNTNNIAEASIRVLKDIVLGRATAYNAVAFVEFCVSVFEPYMVKRLLNVAYSRNPAGQLLYSELMQRCQAIDVNQVHELEDDVYSVPDSTGDDVYKVYAKYGFCECPRGKQGAFCKHQALIHSIYGGMFPNMPPVNVFVRHTLAKVALGENQCPSVQFFVDLRNSEGLDLQNTTCSMEENDNFIDSTASDHAATTISTVSGLEESHNSENESHDTAQADYEQAKVNLTNEVLRLSNLLTCSSSSIAGMKKLKNSLAKIQNESQLVNFLLNTPHHRSKVIRVQPTSMARRRPGVTRGCKRIAAGRPSGSKTVKRQKRVHNLSRNIALNVPNAKIHGSGH